MNEEQDQAAKIRTGAHATGSRVLEMFAGTPQLNDWYYSKFRDRVSGDVLELGSGIGNISRLLARDARTLMATDVEDEYLDALRQEFSEVDHVSVARFDLESPPPAAVAERQYDVVISMNVIEHVHDDLGAVRALAKLLRPGGWMLTYVPACNWAFNAMDQNLGHHRRYSTRSFERLLKGADLDVERLEYMNLLGLFGWWVNGKLLRKQTTDERQVRTFERLVPLVRLEDHLRVPVGLGVVAHARKPLHASTPPTSPG